MAKNKTVHAGTYFTVYLDEEQVRHIKSLALQLSVQQGYSISASNLVRDAINLIYPLPKQLDAFGEMGKRRRIKKTSKQLELF
jgi:hypothetical protein